MANLHWVFQLVILAIVLGIDAGTGRALLGFCIATFYLAASLWALIRGDRVMLKRRAFVFALFVAEVLVVASWQGHPPDLGVLQRWIDKLAGHEYYKTK